MDGSLPINQLAYISMIDIEEGFNAEYQFKNAAYFFLIEGEVVVGNETLQKRDAIGISETENVSINATKDSKLLIIDVPLLD